MADKFDAILPSKGTRRGDVKEVLAQQLEEARERTRFLLAGVSEGDLVSQHDPIMSPPIWDYGHIGNYEELWLLKKTHGQELSDRELYDMYDASLHPREERPSLNLLMRGDADAYLDAVRRLVLETLAGADLKGDDALFRDGFVYAMILQHEAQHDETMLQTFQLMKGRGYRPESPVELPESPAGQSEGMVHVPGGEFVMGTDDRPGPRTTSEGRISWTLLPCFWTGPPSRTRPTPPLSRTAATRGQSSGTGRAGST